MPRLWVRKSIAALEAEAAEPHVQAMTTHGGVPLKRTLSAVNLVSLGIGATIGAGIFVLTGGYARCGRFTCAPTPMATLLNPTALPDSPVNVIAGRNPYRT